MSRIDVIHAITEEQIDRRVVASIEQGIRRVLADRDFCPDSARITRYERMPISQDLMRDLNARYQECWLGFDEGRAE